MVQEHFIRQHKIAIGSQLLDMTYTIPKVTIFCVCILIPVTIACQICNIAPVREAKYNDDVLIMHASEDCRVNNNVLCFLLQSGSIISGGEDGIVCLWQATVKTSTSQTQ